MSDFYLAIAAHAIAFGLILVTEADLRASSPAWARSPFPVDACAIWLPTLGIVTDFPAPSNATGRTMAARPRLDRGTLGAGQ